MHCRRAEHIDDQRDHDAGVCVVRQRVQVFEADGGAVSHYRDKVHCKDGTVVHVRVSGERLGKQARSARTGGRENRPPKGLAPLFALAGGLSRTGQDFWSGGARAAAVADRERPRPRSEVVFTSGESGTDKVRCRQRGSRPFFSADSRDTKMTPPPLTPAFFPCPLPHLLLWVLP